MLARTIQNLLLIASFMTEPKKQPCLPTLLHKLVVLGLVQFFFQPSFFLRGNGGRSGLAAAAGCCGFCVQMGITSLQFGYKKAPPSRAVRRQSLEMELPEITYIFSDALINFLQWILFDLE